MSVAFKSVFLGRCDDILLVPAVPFALPPKRQNQASSRAWTPIVFAKSQILWTGSCVPFTLFLSKSTSANLTVQLDALLALGGCRE